MPAKKSSAKKIAPKYPTKREAELRKMVGEETHAFLKNQISNDSALRRLVDPHLRHYRHSLFIAKLLFTDFPQGSENHRLYANQLLFHIKNDSVSDLKKLFSSIIGMREHAEETRVNKQSNLAFAANALKRFSKKMHGAGNNNWYACDFRDYLIEEGEKAGINFPPKKNGGSWTDIYRKLGIADRTKRTGIAKATKGKRAAT